MNKIVYLIVAQGPADFPGLWAMACEEKPALARAWIAWFSKDYREVGWTDFEYHQVSHQDYAEMISSLEEINSPNTYKSIRKVLKK